MVKLYQDIEGETMELIGGRLSSSYIQDFLSNSYDKSAPDTVGDFVKDKKLSGQRAQVYYNPKTMQAVVIHRGSQGLHDWGNNLKMALGFNMSDTKRFSHGKKIQKEAEAKYGAKNISTLGHSLGGKIASDVGKESGEIITLNKPVVGRDLFKDNQGKKENETNIRTEHDLVSALDRKADFTIPSKSINTIAEHSTDVLKRTDKDFGKSDVGAGFTRKNIAKLKKKELKDVIKSLPKIKDGFKLVGKGKPDLVNYICKRCGAS
jgi:hypothetical protein